MYQSPGHPNIDVNAIKELSVDEIQKKLKDIITKLNYSYSTGNQAMIFQLEMARESYTRAQMEKLNEMFATAAEEGRDTGTIDIS